MSILIIGKEYAEVRARATRRPELTARYERIIVWERLATRKMTRLLCTLIALFAVIYLGTIYRILNDGFVLQQEANHVTLLTRENQKAELELGQQEARIVEQYPDVFAAMVKISAIKYLTPDNVAAAETPSNP